MIWMLVQLLRAHTDGRLGAWFDVQEVGRVVGTVKRWRLTEEQAHRVLAFNERLIRDSHPEAVMEWDQLASGLLDGGGRLDPFTREVVEEWAIANTNVLRRGKHPITWKR